jgi:hypothetical protein
MNDFDFFTVSASSSSIRSLMKLPNVKRENIQTRVYYSGRGYSANFYKVHLKFFDVMEVGHYTARQMADEFMNKIVATKPDNVILSRNFEPRD